MMVIDLMILCEGITDQALLGCYIEDVSDWKYAKWMKVNPFPNEEDITWYSNGEEHLLGVWSNGGDDFIGTLETICKREIHENLIKKIIVITDNDDETAETKRIEDIYASLKKNLKGAFSNDVVTVNGFNRISWNGDFGKFEMEVGYLLVPLEGHGAMETFMLEALSENLPERKEVISQVECFLESFVSTHYLVHRRDRVKAKLGVSMSIMNPDKSFRIMKEMIDAVDWGNYKASYQQFKMLRDSL